MSATLYPTLPHREPVAAPATRLTLKTDGASRGLLDGAWWPRSRDLLSELPALTDVLDPLWGRVTRIAVNPEHWPAIPREIPVSGALEHPRIRASEPRRHGFRVPLSPVPEGGRQVARAR